MLCKVAVCTQDSFFFGIKLVNKVTEQHWLKRILNLSPQMVLLRVSPHAACMRTKVVAGSAFKGFFSSVSS